MTEVEQWKNDLFVYNEDYEKIALKVKDLSNRAYGLVGEFKPLTAEQFQILASVGVALSVQLQRLVDSRAEAAYNYRGVKNFYERTLKERKLVIMGRGEKKTAAGVAEDQALIESFAEFDLVNEAERYAETSDKRWESTERLIASVRTKLDYGQHP